MKLIRVGIQDGESQYLEYATAKNEQDALKRRSDWVDGFLRAIRSYDIMDITEKEIQVLEKFSVV